MEGREQLVFQQIGSETSKRGGGRTLLIGGMHGDETATILLLDSFVKDHLPRLSDSVMVLPLCNPDGRERRSRYNARGVDLNRNCGFNWSAESEEPSGPGPWSEPESVALRDLILEERPTKIISLHWALAEIDADGAQSTSLACAMWTALDEQEKRPYRLRVTELGRGQRRLQETYAACPGSLGQWCGYGLEYPDGTAPAMITLELPYDAALPSRPEELPPDHLLTLRESWDQDSDNYLRAVEGPVFKMLTAACRF